MPNTEKRNRGKRAPGKAMIKARNSPIAEIPLQPSTISTPADPKIPTTRSYRKTVSPEAVRRPAVIPAIFLDNGSSIQPFGIIHRSYRIYQRRKKPAIFRKNRAMSLVRIDFKGLSLRCLKIDSIGNYRVDSRNDVFFLLDVFIQDLDPGDLNTQSSKLLDKDLPAGSTCS